MILRAVLNRAAYRAIMAGGRHAYMSTYCQHGRHDGCKGACKCCGAECFCSGCTHPVRAPDDSPCA